METWVIVVIIVCVIAAIVGNLSMLQRSTQPLRRKSLNDLQETLPRAGEKQAQLKQERKNKSK
ncbi:hypothetical protein [Thalassomonas sp. M1454]|uniref:hypothetical protein n=1 Tax=Thalassomonas sp. M1454 TaxID=2594477 RepID=UPI00117D982F|nr:hypothetical protein [Thalassomonas sp. M1454]TRX56715.1 hypothetical protein FNN08_04080 [Thalassomonas sp. M1454]